MANKGGRPGAAPAGHSEPGEGRDAGTGLRVAALATVAVGLVVLTGLACVLSYPSLHYLAAQASVSATLAKAYPVAFDALFVVAGCSVLALRGAGLGSRVYAWLTLLVVLTALAAGSVVHAAGLGVPRRPAAIAAATIPWALVLIGFGLLVALLRFARLRRSGDRMAGGRAPAVPLADPGLAQVDTAAAGPTQARAASEERPDPGEADVAGVDVAGVDVAGVDTTDGGIEVGEFAELAGEVVVAQAPRTRPFARPADLQLRARVPAGRHPPTVETAPHEVTLPSQAAPPMAVAGASGADAPSNAAMAADAIMPDAIAVVDEAEAASPTKPNPRHQVDELAEPIELRRPHGSPTPPD